jgi:hypothetical protein
MIEAFYTPELEVPDKNGVLRKNGERLILRTPFALKDAVKALPGARWAPKPLGVWHVPATVETAGAVYALIQRRGIPLDADEHTLRLMDRSVRSKEAQAFKTAEDLAEIPGRYCQCDEATRERVDAAVIAADEMTQGMCRSDFGGCGFARATWMHQRQAFHSMHPREGCGLFMDMGTGKSKPIIALAEADEVDRMVIVAPERPLKIWPKQFRLHAERDWVVINHGGYYKAGPRKGQPKFTASMKERIAEAERQLEVAELTGRPFCLVVNYAAAWQEPIRKWLLHPPWEQPNEKPWGVGVVDEGHAIKSPGGKWSNFCADLGKRCARRIDATGTPMPHSEPDIYGQARFLDPGIFGTSFKRFRDHYFEMGGFENRQIQGFKSEGTEAEFLRKLGELGFFVDAKDEDPITFELGKEALGHYKTMAEEYIADVGSEDENDPVIARNTLAQMVRLSQITSGHLPVGTRCLCTQASNGDQTGNGDLRGLGIPDLDCPKCHGTGISGTQVVEIDDTKERQLEELLDSIAIQEKVVVFGRFVHDLDVIQRVAEKQGRRYKEVSGRRADGLDNDGVMVEDCDVVGVQLQAGGTGVDMTRARYCIYYSLSFSLGDFLQTKARVHRPGQTRTTFYYYLTAESTIDQVILRALLHRDDVVKSVIRAARGGELVA